MAKCCTSNNHIAQSNKNSAKSTGIYSAESREVTQIVLIGLNMNNSLDSAETSHAGQIEQIAQTKISTSAVIKL